MLSIRQAALVRVMKHRLTLLDVSSKHGVTSRVQTMLINLPTEAEPGAPPYCVPVCVGGDGEAAVLELVVVRDLLAHRNVAQRKDAYPRLPCPAISNSVCCPWDALSVDAEQRQFLSGKYPSRGPRVALLSSTGTPRRSEQRHTHRCQRRATFGSPRWGRRTN